MVTFRRFSRWLYRWSHRRQRIEPMIDGPLMTRLLISNEVVTDGPRSALQ